MTREKVLDKIEKLLRLSSSDNIGESYNALSMARKLMSKYHIEEAEVSANLSDSEVIEKRVCFEFTERWSSWVVHLGSICRYNRCRVLMNFTSKYKRQLSVIGEKVDADYTTKVLEYAYSMICKGIDDRRTLWYEKGLRRDQITDYVNSYALGYIRGLIDHYESQDSSGDTSLMVIIPDTVTKYIESMDLGENHRSDTIQVEGTTYNEGYRDGSEFFNRDRLNEGDMRYLS